MENLIINPSNLYNILGENDRNLKALKFHFQTEIVAVSNTITVISENEKTVDRIQRCFLAYDRLSSMKVQLRERDIIYIASIIEKRSIDDIVDFYKDREELVKNFQGKPLYPKTFTQAEYIRHLNKDDIIFAYGPAGVGKTYLAVCDAVKKYRSGKYQKIILSRPIVEAGESLGFLPGEIKEKVDPYLIPLYDALYELLGKRATDEAIENGSIEIAPLAYMRGRTLENAYIILDEAQNTTVKQMKLFLTRLGFNAKMVITGDLTQIDLVKSYDSGLRYAVNKLEGVPGIRIQGFDKSDVVRNPLVQRIIERFEEND